VRAKQEAGEHEDAGKERQNVPGEESGNIFLKEDVVNGPQKLAGEGDGPTDCLHDPKEAEPTSSRYGVTSKGDDESDEEEGTGGVTDSAEGHASGKKGRGHALYECKYDRRSHPIFRGLTQGEALDSTMNCKDLRAWRTDTERGSAMRLLDQGNEN